MPTDTTVEVEGTAALRNGACQVIAEAGANHNNSVERAIEMSRRAAEAGAWAIKFQLYKADTISVPTSPKYWNDPFGTATQHEAFALSDKLAYSDYGHIADACRDLGIAFFATPFDLPGGRRARVDAVLALQDRQRRHHPPGAAGGGGGHQQAGPAVHRRGHGRGGRPAIEWMGIGPDRLVLLVCTLTYPTPDDDGHFARIPSFRERFSPYLIGMSDHTLGAAGAWMTAALGGVCIEKHYTIDKKLPDVPDHAMSVDPGELTEMVQACHRASVLRGDATIGVRDSELPARANARRSIVLERDVAAGVPLTAADLGFKRPGTGIPPFDTARVLGARLREDRPRGTILVPEHLEPVDVNVATPSRSIHSGFLRSRRAVSRPARPVGGRTGAQLPVAAGAGLPRWPAAIQAEARPATGPLAAVFAYRSVTAFAGVLGTLAGRPGLRAAEPHAAARAHAHHARALRCADADRRRRVGRPAARGARRALEPGFLVIAPDQPRPAALAAALPDHRVLGAGDLPPARGLAAARSRPRRHRLPALHLRQHGHPEGRHGRPPQRGPLRGLPGRALRDRRARPLLPDARPDLRQLGAGHVRGVGARRLRLLPARQRADEARLVHSRPGADRLVLGAVHGHLRPPPRRAQAGQLPDAALEPVRRRAAAGRGRAGVARGCAGLDGREPLRADRGHRGLHAPPVRSRDHARRVRARRGADRSPAARHGGAGGRCRPARGGPRRAGRAAGGRPPGHARVLARSRAHRRRVRGSTGPVGAPLPDGRPGAQAAHTPAAPCPTWVASTTRSRCAGCARSWARWRRSCARSPASTPSSPWAGRPPRPVTTASSRSWPPTSWTFPRCAQRLAARLHANMVPRRFELLAQLPLNANGKFDRNALKALLQDDGG